MIDYEIKSQQHKTAAHVCSVVLEELDAVFSSPCSVDMMHIEICVHNLFGEKYIFLTEMFEEYFSNTDIIDIKVLKDKKIYHGLMTSVFDKLAFDQI